MKENSAGRPTILVIPDGGEIVSRTGFTATSKSTTGQTDGALACLELMIAPGTATPLHSHSEADEIWYILDGSVTLSDAAGGGTACGPDSSVFIPAGAAHGLANATDRSATVFIYHSPVAKGSELDSVRLSLGEGQLADGVSAGIITQAAGEGESLTVLGDDVRYLVNGEQTGGRFTLFVEDIRPGAGVPPHMHHREDEIFYVREGAITFMLPDGSETVAPAGSFLYSPAGTPHAWFNRTDRMAKTMVATTPGGFDTFFRQINGLTDPARVVAIAAEYGIEFVPPPAGADVK